MVRQFEFSQQAGREEKSRLGLDTPTESSNGKRSRLSLQALAWEEENKLVQRVFLSPNSGSPRAVVFSGVQVGDGCSCICALAGEILASRVPGSVCLLDADLRSPSLHKYLGPDYNGRLTDAVRSLDTLRSSAQTRTAGNLRLVSWACLVSDPYTLLKSDRLQPRMADLRAEFDYLLVDAPPVNLYADAISLGQLSDGLVLVVGANSARREAARKAKQSLQAANVRLLAAVLNKRTYPIPEALYRRLRL